MPDRFPILGESTPPLYGHTKPFREVTDELRKKTPGHQSVVGAQFVGKTVFARAVQESLRSSGIFAIVDYWDLGHLTPRNDAEFMQQLCRRVDGALKKCGVEDLGEFLTGEYSLLCSAIDEIASRGLRILMLWDGFDHPLTRRQLSRNLWDNLLELCKRPAFRLVTFTRKELRELIRNEESVTSDFWAVFSEIRLLPFNETDVDGILRSTGRTFATGAITEMRNATGWFPPLLLGLLNELQTLSEGREIGAPEARAAASDMLRRHRPLVAELWDNCATETQDLYRALMEQRTIAKSHGSFAARLELSGKGLAIETGDKIQICGNVVEAYVLSTAPDSGGMSRMFGTKESYHANIRSFFELRLSQVRVVDANLHRLVLRSIGDLPNYPNNCLNDLTHIEEGALDLIWSREVGKNGEVPSEIVAYWTAEGREKDPIIREMMTRAVWRLPRHRGGQLRLLQLLTGCWEGFDPKGRFATKDMFALLDSIHTYRNRNQHCDGEPVPLGVAVAALSTCIELLDLIATQRSCTEKP